MSRQGVGYCLMANCEEFTKGTFLLNRAEFWCHVCRVRGACVLVENEERGEGDLFHSVEVEFDYCPLEGRYQSTAIIKDTTCPLPARTMVVHDPLIRTKTRALVVAERILANLRWYGTPEKAQQDIDLGLDRADFAKRVEVVFESRRTAA